MMMYPGLSDGWIYFVLSMLAVITVRGLFAKPLPYQSRFISCKTLPVVGAWFNGMVTRPWVLLVLRITFVAIFLLVISSGLFGSPVPERNLATTLTWTVWWPGLLIATYFLGSVWCAVCPWDVLATWLLRLRPIRRGNCLKRRVPKAIRNVWPASGMFIILAWLEWGFGLTTSPYGTAILSLVVVVLVLASQLVYERKAFCRYFCSVGRSIGFYASLSPVALRPVDQAICNDCKTLECFKGNDEIEPCPTHIVLGRSKQNTFCTSCGACSQSCPYQNVNWALRKTGEEAIYHVRPSWDESWFILFLLSLTGFHGVIMLPGWEEWAGRSLWSFSSGMLMSIVLPISGFALIVKILQWRVKQGLEFKRLFAVMGLPFLPLAFAYQLARNLNHLAYQGRGLTDVLLDPLGFNTLPMTDHEMPLRYMTPLVPQDILFALQAGLMILGFWFAVRILQHRVTTLELRKFSARISITASMLLLIMAVTLIHLWLLMQPMIMRM